MFVLQLDCCGYDCGIVEYESWQEADDFREMWVASAYEGHERHGVLKRDDRFFPTLCICGSMRFFETMLEVAKTLTLQGYIVLMPFVASFTEIEKHDLDAMHFAKIDKAEGIYVVNPGGYIGESTRNEIAYATSQKKYVKYWEKPND